MKYKTLKECLLNEGIKDKKFYGIVGGKKREYRVLGLELIGLKDLPEYFEASIKIEIIGEDVPTKIKEKRKEIEVLRQKGFLGNLLSEKIYGDYNLPLSNHYQDKYIEKD